MNKIFRTIWSDSVGNFIAVAEIVSGLGRGSGKRFRLRLLVTSLMLTLWICSGFAVAAELPGGGNIVAGSGTITTSDTNMSVTQNTNRMITDWTSFSIGENNTVNFVQPGSDAAALNRVLGNQVSEIRGALNANGQIFLVNPNGLIFSNTARVNVGSLVTSTLDINNDDFLAGNYRFSGDSSNAIINQGNIQAGDGGTIAMIAAHIINDGTLSANGGDVLMGAGSKVLLDLGGPVKLEIEQGALDTLIDNGGAIKADGGSVYLSAKAAGDLASSVINHDGTIEAQTLQPGADGSIMLMGDMEQGQMSINGTLDASAPQSGDGGFVETSAAEVNIGEHARVNTLASDGATGTWLIDPTLFTIEEGAAAETASGIGNQTLVSNLSSSDIQIIDSGMISVDADVVWSDPTSLELTSGGIRVNARIENTNTTQGGVFFSGIDDAAYDVEFNADGVIGINSLEQLGWVNTAVNPTEDLSSYTVVGNYELGADIDASATQGWNSGAGFDPIGPGKSTPFVGTFDGKGYSIHGLFINRPAQGYVGLFGAAIGANIQNTSLNNLDISGQEYIGGLAGFTRDSVISGVSATGTVTGGSGVVGGLAGYDNGIIRNSSAAVDVTGSYMVGGLVGQKDPGEVNQSHATGSVTQTGATGRAGGLIGRLYSASVQQSYATGDVNAEGFYVGGLVGQMDASSPSIDASYATGNVSSTEDMIGGLVGSAVGTVTNSYFTGTVTSTGNKVGGFAGELLSSSSVENSYSTATINADASAVDVGGFVGYAAPSTTNPVTLETTPGGTVTNSFWDYEASGLQVSPDFSKGIPLSSSDMKNPKYYFNWDSNIWSIPQGSAAAGYEVGLPYLTNVTLTADVPNRSTLFDDGFGTSADPWAITDWTQLASVAAPDPRTQWHFALQSDLDTGTHGYSTQVADGDLLANGGIGWLPVGSGYSSGFTGVFDGNNHQIDSLKISDSSRSGDYKGLFGYVRNGARITDLQLSNVNIQGTDRIGSLAGSAEQDVHVENVQVNGGSIIGMGTVGGLVGRFGAAPNSIQDSHVNLDVSGNSRVGGLVGDVQSASIRNSTSAGTVTGQTYVGGLAGSAYNANISGSSSRSNVYQSADVVDSGDMMLMRVAANYFGGIAGHTRFSTLENSSASGDMQITNGADVRVGGAIGYAEATTLDSIQASGSIDVVDANGSLAVGGLVGEARTLWDWTTDTTQPTSIVDSKADNTLSINTLEDGTLSQTGIGGLVGVLRYGNRIERSSATGIVSAPAINKVGGLVGMNENSHIEQSFATGDVEGYDAVGGLVGWMGNAPRTIVNSYATGRVTGHANVGGLVGYLGDSSIASSYASGEISGLNSVGGLVGFSENSTISNSFWDIQTTKQATGVGGTDADNVPGLSSLEMKDISIFSASGWDISAQGGEDTVWRIYEGDTYPLLRAHFQDTVTATLTADDRSYDGTTLLTGADFSLPAEFNRDLVLKSDPLAYVSDDKNAGTRNIVLDEGSIYSNQEGYDLIITPSTVEIIPADLTITANADTKTYDGLAYSGGNGVTYAGFVNGEGEDVLSGALNYTGTSQGAVNAGNYVITPEGLNGSNYNIDYVAADLTIQELPENPDQSGSDVSAVNTTVNQVVQDVTQVINQTPGGNGASWITHTAPLLHSPTPGNQPDPRGDDIGTRVRRSGGLEIVDIFTPPSGGGDLANGSNAGMDDGNIPEGVINRLVSSYTRALQRIFVVNGGIHTGSSNELEEL